MQTVSQDNINHVVQSVALEISIFSVHQGNISSLKRRLYENQ